MAQLVSMGASLLCASGSAPAILSVVDARVLAESQPVANIMDYIPATNIPTFGTCSVLTAAASGVSTPCAPAIVAPWTPGSPTVTVRGQPALNNTSTCACTIGGAITITDPGTTKETVA